MAGVLSEGVLDQNGPKWRKMVKTTILVKISLFRPDFVNSVQTRCIVKARLRKVHFSGDFLGVFDFLRIACSLGIPQETFKFSKIPFFPNAPCKTTCLYNAPSMHTVDFGICETKMDQNGPFGPFWPKEVYFGTFRSAKGTLAIHEGKSFRPERKLSIHNGYHAWTSTAYDERAPMPIDLRPC